MNDNKVLFTGILLLNVIVIILVAISPYMSAFQKSDTAGSVGFVAGLFAGGGFVFSLYSLKVLGGK